MDWSMGLVCSQGSSHEKEKRRQKDISQEPMYEHIAPTDTSGSLLTLSVFHKVPRISLTGRKNLRSMILSPFFDCNCSDN
jgi:hypothetical protein